MSAKPIFEQLQANADKKQEEYDAVTKALQAAACPQALDEDDVNHFESLEQRKAAQKQVGGEWGRGHSPTRARPGGPAAWLGWAPASSLHPPKPLALLRRCKHEHAPCTFTPKLTPAYLPCPTPVPRSSR